MRSIKHILLFLFFLIFFLIFSLISLWRFNIGQVFYYDFGHFARIIWLISRFQEPIINHKVLGHIHFLGDHFSPSIYFLAPLFWITDTLQILSIQQSLCTVISGFLIYKIGVKEKLPKLIALCISFVFFLFAGVENPLVTDWHTESTASVFLLLFLYYILYTKQNLITLLWAIIFAGFKDSNALSLIFILIPLFISEPKKRKLIGLLIIFAFLWFMIVSYILTPLISKQPYLYSPILPGSPREYLIQFFNLPIKRKLWIDTLISFGFLPVLSGIFFLPIIGELSIRLIPTYIHSQSFTLGMHYNVFLSAFLSFSVIKLFHFISHKTRKKLLLIILTIYLVLTALIAGKKITHSPIFLSTNPVFWREWNKKSEIFNQLKFIPTEGSVMSQNNMLPHFIQRKESVYLLSNHYGTYLPKYIIFDLSPGQNINNYYSGEIRSLEQVLLLRNSLLHDSRYKRIKTSYDELYFFIRI